MRMYDLIVKKRDGIPLSEEEIYYIINGFTNGSIPDYQMSAFLMAVFFNGMNEKETLDLTMAMTKSGDQLDLSGIDGIKVDKHSTGGVGDKTTLVLAPMIAACGVPVAKMSGRGLGHTGGTIDKLECFNGFNTAVSKEDFIRNVNKINLAIAGQTGDLAPADKKIYALRDVTGTVNSIPLIAGSIMSKKLASGADAIILDIKCGNGAFMKHEKEAILLATEMVKLGNNVGKKTVGIITDMNQPLGFAVGNALEVKEAIETLKGNGPDDLMELCFVLGSYMLIAGKKASSKEEARLMLEEVIKNGAALSKFAEFIERQGGDTKAIYDTELLPKAKHIVDVIVDANGFVGKILTTEIGIVSLILGGGRETKDSKIDLSVGVILKKKIGDSVNEGEAIATLYGNDLIKIEEARNKVLEAFTIYDTKVNTPKLIKRIID